MKTALLAAGVLGVLVLCASASFGQSVTAGTLSATPQIYSFEGHPEHAMRTPLAQEQQINGGETVVSAVGERPLWEVATIVHERPLGDVAREFRAQRLLSKKAVMSLFK